MLHQQIHHRSFLAFAMLSLACVTAHAATGDDLLVPFAWAQAGEPLRVVAIGGSITQVGAGWVGPWLRETFPQSRISVHNAGMSGTGSQLAIFRLEKPPAIVMIEAAQRGREFIPPQREVAEHYGLLTVDLQATVQKHLVAKDLAWEDLLPDGGHPNSAGHNFYRETVAAALRPFAERAGRAAPTACRSTPEPSSSALPPRLKARARRPYGSSDFL